MQPDMEYLISGKRLTPLIACPLAHEGSAGAAHAVNISQIQLIQKNFMLMMGGSWIETDAKTAVWTWKSPRA